MRYKLLGEYIKEHPILGVFFDKDEYTKYSYKDLYVLTEEIIKYKVNMLAEFVYICHPLANKKLSPRIEKFQSYLKPRFYITEEDFGYYFDGLKREDEAIIDLFFKLYSRSCVVTTGKIISNDGGIFYMSLLSNNYNRDTYKDFISKSMKQIFSELICAVESHFLYEALKTNKKYKYIQEMNLKEKPKVTLSVVKKLLEEKLGLSTSEATKVTLLLDSKLSLESLITSFAETNIWGILYINTFKRIISGNELFRELYRLYPKKLVEAMNKDKKEVLFSMNTSKVVIMHIKSLDSFRFAIVNENIIVDVDEVL